MSPTGYTERLYDGEQPFEEFVLHAARAFGALIEMRDMGLDATVPETFEPSPYHRDHANEARARLAAVSSMSDPACQIQADADHGAWVTTTAANRATTAARRARYESMRERVLAWTPPTDEHTGLRDFMVQQLDESASFDTNDYTAPEPTTDGAEWRVEAIAKAERDIEYHETEFADDVRRAAERTEWVRALRDSLAVSA